MNNGWCYISKGFSLINQPGIRVYVIIPTILNIIVFGLMIWGLHDIITQLTIWIDGYIPSWLQWLDWFIWIAFGLTVFIFFVYTSTLVASIIAAPFNGILSEKVELHLTNKKIECTRSVTSTITNCFLRQAQFIGYILPRAALFIVLSFIPIINIAAPLFWFLFSAWLTSVQYFDFVFDNHDISFDKMIKSLKKKQALGYSFGSLVFALSLIPIINLVIVQAAVAGATAAFIENFND